MAVRPLRLGFLGTGWIGRHRMEAMRAAGLVAETILVDPDAASLDAARRLAPDARTAGSIDELLMLAPDGIVIATPSALHAAQAIRALDAGVAVFCQKPLGRTAAEAAAVVAAARGADRLLGLDLSYRETAAMQAIRPLVRSGALGRVFAADLMFHNAHGPDKAWFRDRALSGGGCVMDLGVHLVDLALWALGFPAVEAVTATLRSHGQPLADRHDVEDYAVATLSLADGATASLACSWNLHAGAEAVIAARFYGTAGGAGFRNLDGSFFDFEAHHNRGTARTLLANPPDPWGGRAAAAWVHRLAAGHGFDPAADQFTTVTAVLDRIYAAGGVA